MNVVRLNFLPRFDFGDDAVLLTLDSVGTTALRGAVLEAISTGTSTLTTTDGMEHVLAVRPGPSDLTIARDRVRWNLGPNKAQEIAEGLEVLDSSGSAGHVYVEIDGPAPSLVLSRDEYVHERFPWVDPPASPRAHDESAN